MKSEVYTILESLDELESFNKKKEKLNKVFEQNESADVVGSLAQLYTIEELLPLVKGLSTLQHVNKEIKIIGMFFFKMANGGTEKVCSLLSKLWIEMGYDVVLFTDEPPTTLDFYVPVEVKRVVLTHSSEIEIDHYFERAKEFSEKIKEHNIDIMIYHAWTSRILFWDLLLVKSMKIPFIVYTHSIFATVYHYRDEQINYIHKIFQSADCVVSLTEVSQKYYEYLGCNSIYTQNPIDSKLKNVKQPKLDGKTILWIGRISTEKNPMDILEVFKIVQHSVPDAKLKVVGNDDARQISLSMKEFCFRNGIEDCVEFCGHQKEVDSYYRQSDIIAITSEFEGYSLTLLESKAYGLPCVMYELPYLSLVKDKKGYVAVKQKDKSAMALQIINLLQDDDTKKRLGREARESFEKIKEFDLRKSWVNIIESVQNIAFADSEETLECEMLQMLIEHSNIGTMNEIQKIKEKRAYKIGDALLKFPRKLRSLVKRL